MKKFYSLVAVAAFSTFSIAQTAVLTETFNSLTAGGNTTSSGAGSPDGTDIYAGGTAAALPNFPTGSKGYSGGGMLKLGTGSVVGTTNSKAINLSTDSGNVKIVLDVKGWTVTPATFDINLLDSSGAVYATKTVNYTAVMSGNTEKVTATFTGGKANSTVQIVTNAAAYRLYIDNIVITTEPNLGTINYTEAAKAVSNTLWTNTASFNVKEKSTVEVYNMNGQLVKSFEVNGVQNVNVSSLTKGTYVVKTTANGKTATQKVVKK